jgi:hypothetical protein
LELLTDFCRIFRVSCVFNAHANGDYTTTLTKKLLDQMLNYLPHNSFCFSACSPTQVAVRRTNSEGWPVREAREEFTPEDRAVFRKWLPRRPMTLVDCCACYLKRTLATLSSKEQRTKKEWRISSFVALQRTGLPDELKLKILKSHLLFELYITQELHLLMCVCC